MAFRLFFELSKLTKIVLLKVLQKCKLYLLAPEMNQKRFSFFPRNIQYRVRLTGPPSRFFRQSFFRIYHQRVPSIFLICDRMDEESQSVLHGAPIRSNF